MINNEQQIRQLLISLDNVEKYILLISDPFGEDIKDYYTSMKLMKDIIHKLLKYLPNKLATNNNILLSIKKDIIKL